MKGSISVFSALCLMLVASLLLALLESARVYGLDTCAGLLADLGIESVCGEYQGQLWEDYRILCLDGGYGTGTFSMDAVSGRFCTYLSKNLSMEDGGTNLFAMELSNVLPVSYELLTDGDGSVFFDAVSSYMKENLPKEAVEEMLERYQKKQELEEEGDSYCVEDASDALEKAKKEAKEAEDTEETEETEEMEEDTNESEKENPLDIVLELKRNAILGMVVKDTGSLSVKKNDLSDSLLKRKVCTGTAAVSSDGESYKRILVLEYADKYFSDYTNPSTNRAFSYELEYVLCGKEEDKANLEGTVERLLALREAANVVHVVKDSTKRKQALELAEALAGFTANPVLIKLVQTGIIAAWAYMESIQDVRALLDGDKIALLKTNEQWTLDTEHLLDSFQGTGKAKNCSNGLSYSEYIKLLLYAMQQKQLAYRMMDVMEQNLRHTKLYQDCRMDHMICSMEYSVDFKANALFSKLVTIGRLNVKQYAFIKSTQFSYIK